MCTIGLYPALRLLQFHVRDVVLEKLAATGNEDNLMTFTDLDQNKEVVWEGPHEFHYKGIMYDVVKTTTAGGITISYCYTDDRESKVYSCIQRLVNRQLDNGNSSSGAASRYLLKLLTQVFIPSGSCCINADFNTDAASGTGGIYKWHYSVFFSNITVPPPKCA